MKHTPRSKRAKFFATLRMRMGGECEVCGKPDSYTRDFRGKWRSVLEFHHIKPRETHGGTRVTSLGMKSAISEAAQCMLLCVECHSAVHGEGACNEEVPV